MRYLERRRNIKMPVIELIDMNKSYNNISLFENYNLSINEGEFVAVIGKSGSGKSTLLNIIGMIDVMDKGDLIIHGVKNPRINNILGRKLLRNSISYLFQNYALIDDWTVIDNLKLATHFSHYSKKEELRLIKEAMYKVGLEDFLSKKIYQLSGGEQQRVAMARILLKPSDIILADEPTGSLDRDNRDTIMRMLTEINKSGKTVIVVTHDLEVSKCARRIIQL